MYLAGWYITPPELLSALYRMEVEASARNHHVRISVQHATHYTIPTLIGLGSGILILTTLLAIKLTIGYERA